MKWSVLFVGVRRVLLWLVAILGCFFTLFAHSVLALCVVLVASYGLAEGSKIRMLWVLGILGGAVFNQATNRHATVLKAKFRLGKEKK